MVYLKLNDFEAESVLLALRTHCGGTCDLYLLDECSNCENCDIPKVIKLLKKEVEG